MLGFVEVFGSVLVLRGVAASYVAADEAHAKVDPCVSHFYALRAFPFIGLFKFDFVKMRALLRHGASRDYPLAKKRCTSETAIAPSPTAEAQRFTEPWRTSPAANNPGMLVSR